MSRLLNTVAVQLLGPALVILVILPCLGHDKTDKEIRINETLIHPSIDTSVNYDSNPLLMPNDWRQSDFFWEIRPELGFARSNEFYHLQGWAWLRGRYYSKFTENDANSWLELCRLSIGRAQNWRIEFHESYSDITDYYRSLQAADSTSESTPNALDLLDRSERVERKMFTGCSTLSGPLSDKMSLVAKYEYKDVMYSSEDLLNTKEQFSTAEVQYKLTDKSWALFVTEYTEMDNDSLNKPAKYYALRTGWRWRGTQKGMWKGSIGYWVMDLDRAKAISDTVNSGLSYSLLWHWQICPILSAWINGGNEMVLTPDSPQNSKLVNRVNMNIKYTIARRITCTIEGGYRNETYTLAESVINGVPITHTGQLFHIGIRGEFRVFRGFLVFSELWQDNAKDNVLGDYIENRFSLGTRIEF